MKEFGNCVGCGQFVCGPLCTDHAKDCTVRDDALRMQQDAADNAAAEEAYEAIRTDAQTPVTTDLF